MENKSWGTLETDLYTYTEYVAPRTKKNWSYTGKMLPYFTRIKLVLT